GALTSRTFVCPAASFTWSRSSTGTHATCSVGRSGATLESEFCVSALNRSPQVAKPEIFNTDQGSQFANCAFTGILKEREIAISMDGQDRARPSPHTRLSALQALRRTRRTLRRQTAPTCVETLRRNASAGDRRGYSRCT